MPEMADVIAWLVQASEHGDTPLTAVALWLLFRFERRLFRVEMYLHLRNGKRAVEGDGK